MAHSAETTRVIARSDANLTNRFIRSGRVLRVSSQRGISRHRHFLVLCLRYSQEASTQHRQKRTDTSPTTCRRIQKALATADVRLLTCLPETHNRQNRSGRCSRGLAGHRSADSAHTAGGMSVCLRERNVYKSPKSYFDSQIHDPCRINPGGPALRVGDQYDQCLLTTNTDN